MAVTKHRVNGVVSTTKVLFFRQGDNTLKPRLLDHLPVSSGCGSSECGSSECGSSECGSSESSECGSSECESSGCGSSECESSGCGSRYISQ